MLESVIDGVYFWQALQVEAKRHVNGYLFLTRVGPVLVDPPAAAEPILARIEALGAPKAVILTGRHQVRRARQYQSWYGAKVFAPEADRRMLPLEADVYYKGGESLPGGFSAVPLVHQRSPGESALFHARSRVLVASHLVGEPAGYVRMQEDGMYWSFSRAFAAQIRLLELDFDVLLPGRGQPLASGARVALAKYMAGYTEVG